MELRDIYPAVLTILLIGVVLGIGIYILAELNENLDEDSVTVSNETGWVNSTGYTLDGASTPGFNTPVITEVRNESNILVAANYTVSSVGVVTNATAITGFMTPAANYNISYTYLRGGSAYTAVDDTITGVGDFAGWIAIIVVIMAAAIVLGIVLKGFGRRTPGV